MGMRAYVRASFQSAVDVLTGSKFKWHEGVVVSSDRSDTSA